MQRVFSFYYFVFFVAMAATQPFLSLYLSGKGISSEYIGFVLAAGSAAGIVAQPLLGAINDHSQDGRRLLLVSAVLSPLVFAGYAFTQSIGWLMVVAVLFTVVQSSSPIADAMAIEEGAKFGFTYGQIRLWGALSFALSTMVSGYVYHLVGLAWEFVVYALMSVFLIAITLFLPKTSTRKVQREKFFKGIGIVARDRRLVLFILLCFVLSTAITINSTFLPLYYRALHYPLGLVGLNFTMAALVEVPLFYLSGRLIRRMGTLPIVIFASGLFAVKYLLMSFAPGAFVVIAIQLLDGIGYALYWSGAVQVVSELSPAGRSATAQTLFGAIGGSLGNIVGSSFGGWLFGHVGPLGMYGINAGIACIACAGFLLFALFGKPRVTPTHTAAS